MLPVASTAALGLAIVLAWSGVAKLRGLASTISAFERIGLPKPGLLGRAVPVAELAVAGALLVAPRLGALAAIALLVAFTGVLLTIIRSGRSISCGCFGSTNAEPVGPADIVRNIGLLFAAAVALGATDLVRPDLPALVVVSLSALVVGLVMAMASLRHQVGSVFRVELAGEQRAEAAT